LALVIIAIACRSERTSAPVVVVDDGRFRHDLHLPPAMSWPGKTLATVCTECHRPKAGSEAALSRPGTDDHAPCDREQCHGPDFRKLPGKLCETCHAATDRKLPSAELLPYPPQKGRRYLASTFSHARHLDFAGMERAVGFHVSCTDCHRYDESGQLERPTHATCTRCHAKEAVAKGVPAMGDCARCHQRRKSPPTRARKLIVGDLRFAHGRHRRDRRGKRILCAECHRDASGVAATDKHQPPPTDTCVGCHDDSSRSPRTAAMKVCETCHASRSASLRAIPPRSHLPAEEMPANHTLAFREDHEREARRSSRECARCHTFMSSARRDTCDQCHQVMRPRSHTAGWTEFEHGPAAAARQDSCSTCHAADMCISCHSRPPRSHQPLQAFRLSHALPATINVRACLTCHDPSTGFCSGPGCHRGSPSGLPR
jgi:hypothetical protein